MLVVTPALNSNSRENLFDTSALVAALVKEHAHHERAFPYLDRVYIGEMSMAVSTHALVELYSSLTVLKTRPKLTPRQALRTVKEDVVPFAEVVSLDASDYEAVLARMADLGLVSGAIYDGLHVRAAEKIEAAELLTCNGHDFRRMPPEDPTRLVVL